MSFQLIVRDQRDDSLQELALGGSLSVGRTPENDLVLPSPSISKAHARLMVKRGECFLVDLGSTNGTFLNGARIKETRRVGEEDEISIGEFSLRLRKERLPASLEPERSARTAAPTAASAAGRQGASGALEGPREQNEREESESGGRCELDPSIRAEIHARLIEALDLRRLDLDRLGGEELRKKSERALGEIIDALEAQEAIPPDLDRQQLLVDVLDEVLGLGPLEELLADDEVSEVMVNHADQIFVEREGRIVSTSRSFSSNAAVLAVIERIIAPIGRRIDESSPTVDGRLPDGSRIHAIIPPLALKGPCLTIRKFRREKLGIAELVRGGSLSEEMAAFLELAVRSKKNVVIAGGTGSGKTTLLNVLTSFIPAVERIVTVEDAAELQIAQPHWVQLESRPSNLEGAGAVTIRELVRNCLRMRPDRIVVGECRAGEALDMLQAMNTGHDGSLTTLHANSPRDALSRLETLCLMSGMELPIRAIREQIASAVDLIVQQSRFADGSRRVTKITEVSAMEGDVITLQDLFSFEQEGIDQRGKIVGAHVPSGFIPAFCHELEQQGAQVDLGIFQRGEG